MDDEQPGDVLVALDLADQGGQTGADTGSDDAGDQGNEDVADGLQSGLDLARFRATPTSSGCTSSTSS